MTLSPGPFDPAKASPAHSDHKLGVAEVLATLRALAGRIPSPVVRECLETAQADIAFLAGTDAEQSEEEVEGAAADGADVTWDGLEESVREV
jgi:hypothetical protein